MTLKEVLLNGKKYSPSPELNAEEFVTNLISEINNNEAVTDDTLDTIVKAVATAFSTGYKTAVWMSLYAEEDFENDVYLTSISQLPEQITLTV